MGYQRERPAGITILAILFALNGIIAMGMGAVFGSMGAMFGMGGIGAMAGLMMIIVACSVIVGLLYFLVAWGLWTLQSWARIVAIVLGIIGLFNFPVGTIISIIILWYLFKPEIKAAFSN